MDKFVEENSVLKPSIIDKRRNTETIFSENGSFCEFKSNGKNPNEQRRHTIIPVGKKTELFEAETKLMVLEFLQRTTLRSKALTKRLRENIQDAPGGIDTFERKKDIFDEFFQQRDNDQENMTETSLYSSNTSTAKSSSSCSSSSSFTKDRDYAETIKSSTTIDGNEEKTTEVTITENKNEEQIKACEKRAFRKNRKISTEKAKTVAIGEYQRQLVVDEINTENTSTSSFSTTDQAPHKYKRSSSDLTQMQYSAMKKKMKEMQLPLIKWLTEHVKIEEINEEVTDDSDGDDPAGDCDSAHLKTNTSKVLVDEELIIPEFESTNYEVPHGHLPPDVLDDLTEVTPITESKPKKKKNRLKTNLRLAMPRRSIYQLLQSNAFTPETFAVQRLEKISNEIMKDYGESLADPISSLLGPIRKSDSITYDLFADVARQVYDIASDGVLSRVALLLNTVKETMLVGNLDEEQMEMLVDHSTKFVTENVPQELLEEGTWDTLENSIVFGVDGEDGETVKDKKEVVSQEGDWTPYGMAAFTVGIGLAYSCMKS